VYDALADTVSTDFELLDAWRAGDREAGNTLFERHFDAVCRFFANKVTHGVDDLIQKTFLGCIEGRDRFQKQASFRTYLFAVAHNILRAHFRERRRDGVPPDLGETSTDELTPSPSAVFAKHEEQRLLLEGLRRIPLDYQLVLELYYWEDMAAPDLAQVLGIPEGTVRSRLRRAKDALAEKMASLARTPEQLSHSFGDLDGWVRSLRSQITGE
jgi:RNA polymerase sigma factor (sigma-70 family)